MIDFSQLVKIVINGKEVYNQKISPDKEFMAKFSPPIGSLAGLGKPNFNRSGGIVFKFYAP